ncbi:MAG: Asp-tRNA(Asn)/Glu-tRNA(Gln) amidotransferase subunit GatB [bacterium]
MAYKPTIGLEIHIELNTKSKMFCSCLNNPDERKPNINICPVCTAQPGTLPVINEEAVRKVIKTGLSLNCQIPEFSKFDRKNYFYPDLPKGYQISQYDKPLCENGFLEIGSPIFKKIRITRVHLEEDTARLIHEKDTSLVDFNRAGIPLMELVTEPDINSAKEAKQFAEELHLIMHYLDVSDADMEKGEMRVEVNISLSKDSKLGTKVEIKNLNSFRSVERGIDYEIERQTKVLESKGKVIQETRGWLDVKGITVSQREKEEAYDYRYFPEPDLPPLHFTREEVERIRVGIPELPQLRQERFIKEYQLDRDSAVTLVYNKELGDRFEKSAVTLPKDLFKTASDFLINTEAKNYDIPPAHFNQLMVLIKDGKISNIAAKEILTEIIEQDPSAVIEKRGLGQVSDVKELKKIAEEIVKNNQKVVGDLKAGKANALQFLIGQTMAKTKGRANPELVRDILQKLLG